MGNPKRSIPAERQAVYYGGMFLSGIGLLLFFGQFVSNARNFGNFENFESRARSSFTMALVGMGLMIVGGVLMSIGRAGLAGSGVVLDPEQAREDVEPWSRATGGMVADALEEIPLLKQGENPAPVVMVRCPACKHLNDEAAKFCQECGGKLT